MNDPSSWLPADLEERLLGENGADIRQAYADALRGQHPLEELHPIERWRFVVACWDRTGGPPADPCCCCSRKTPEGVERMSITDAEWRRAVVRTVRDHPDWTPD